MQLNHPHVVKTYHAGVSGGLHYIAMEFLDGQTLDERLKKKGKLPPEEVFRSPHRHCRPSDICTKKGWSIAT